MKSKHMRIFCALLAALLLSLTSCGGAEVETETTAPADTAETAAETEETYDFGSLDMGDATFTMLNCGQTYGFYGTLDTPELTGETLSDSIYNRNRKVEELYKIKINVNEDNQLDKAAEALKTAVVAGDDVYDVAFIRDYYMTAAITEGYISDLGGSDRFQFDKPWWDGPSIENTRVGKAGKTLIALGDISLVDFEGTMVAFFNEDMLTDLGLDAPYQLVRDGKWTFDALVEYQKAGANLNGDEAFEPLKGDGNAIYGHVGFQHSINAMIASNNIRYIDTDGDGNLVFGLNNEKFLNTAIALSEKFSPQGEWLFANNGSNTDPEHYEMLFKNGRALFMTAQLKASNNYRDMEATYGIVPIPKWDETQPDYRNLRTFSYVMSVPVTNVRLDETAQIMDAMAYITYTDVIPYFYNGRLSQNNLRNEESAEMLGIIRETRCMDLGTLYGQFTELSNEITNIVNARSTDFASFIAKVQPKMEASIQEIMDVMNG